MDESWRKRANCLGIDPQILVPPFHKTTAEGVSLARRAQRMANKVCPDCEVFEECTLYRIKHNIMDGVWGGVYYGGQRNKKTRWQNEIVARKVPS